MSEQNEDREQEVVHAEMDTPASHEAATPGQTTDELSIPSTVGVQEVIEATSTGVERVTNGPTTVAEAASDPTVVETVEAAPTDRQAAPAEQEQTPETEEGSEPSQILQEPELITAEVTPEVEDRVIAETGETGDEKAAKTPARPPKKRKKSAAPPKTPLGELESGAEMSGKVVGIADFGAFVDIGAETDGLVHISELGEGRVGKVSDVVSLGDEVKVWIKDVNLDQGRISLSMKPKPRYRLRDLKPGMVVEGVVTGVRDYGVFVDIGAETEGLVHVSEMAEGYVNRPSEMVSSGEEVQVRIRKVDRKRRRISLSMKGLGRQAPPPAPQREEPMPTAMELALREALGEMEEEIEDLAEEALLAEEASRDELGEVFSRMLREYREQKEAEDA